MVRIPNDIATHRTGRVLAGLVVVLTIIPMAYFAVGAVFAPGALVPGADNRAAHVYAGYMASRNLAIVLGLAVLLTMRSWRLLGWLAGLVGAVQAADIAIGAVQGQVNQTVFPAVYAAALFAVAVWLVRTTPGVAPHAGSPPTRTSVDDRQ